MEAVTLTLAVSTALSVIVLTNVAETIVTVLAIVTNVPKPNSMRVEPN